MNQENNNEMNNQGYNQQPMNNQGYNQQPMNNQGYNQQPMNNQGYNQQPMNNQGYNQQPMNNQGYNQQPMNNQGYNQQPMNNQGYNQQPMNNQNKKNNKILFAIIGVIILIVIAVVVLIFIMKGNGSKGNTVHEFENNEVDNNENNNNEEELEEDFINDDNKDSIVFNGFSFPKKTGYKYEIDESSGLIIGNDTFATMIMVNPGSLEKVKLEKDKFVAEYTNLGLNPTNVKFSNYVNKEVMTMEMSKDGENVLFYAIDAGNNYTFLGLAMNSTFTINYNDIETVISLLSEAKFTGEYKSNNNVDIIKFKNLFK